MTTFTVPGIPVAQPRQRHRIVEANGRTFSQNYTPQKAPVNVFKAAVQAEAAKHFTAPLEGPVAVEVLFVLPRPKRLIWKKRPMPREAHASKPDIENIAKAFMDAATGICWRDDAQVYSLQARKVYAAGDETPKTVVTIPSLSAVTNGGNEDTGTLFGAES